MTTYTDLISEFNKTKYDFIRNFQSERNVILLAIGGSRSYGTDTENSDWDWRGWH